MIIQCMWPQISFDYELKVNPNCHLSPICSISFLVFPCFYVLAVLYSCLSYSYSFIVLHHLFCHSALQRLTFLFDLAGISRGEEDDGLSEDSTCIQGKRNVASSNSPQSGLTKETRRFQLVNRRHDSCIFLFLFLSVSLNKEQKLLNKSRKQGKTKEKNEESMFVDLLLILYLVW